LLPPAVHLAFWKAVNAVWDARKKADDAQPTLSHDHILG
jgi:hypothetical protein